MAQKTTLAAVRAVEMPPIEDPGDIPDDFEAEKSYNVDHEAEKSMADIFKETTAGMSDNPEADAEPLATEKPATESQDVENAAKIPENGDDSKTADSDDKHREKAELYDQLDRVIHERPVDYQNAVFNSLTPEQQAEFLKANGLQPASKTDEIPDTWTDLTPSEQLVEKHREWLTSGRDQVIAAITSRDRQVAETMYSTAIQRVMLEAIAEEIGLEFGKPDREAIAKAVTSGKTFEDAARELYKSKIAKKAASPDTPRSASSQVPAIKKGANMREIWNHLKQHGAG